ncbi:Non-structural maintenance of chromosomes element 1 [Apophysomyces ossiformis]|uniref:Non-structural maintenance of chromosomes element 1 homolog n=1 Tax=Apophysomyces ossiformis TaxID=679940 RepID=A0A8H7BLX3_9FUNG|nr:Non-structural maintenance of chromosomes element 1 [Apophysomyces ossiformis]
MSFVSHINQALIEFDMILKFAHNERDGQVMIGLINLSEDIASREATQYSSNDINHIKKLVIFVRDLLSLTHNRPSLQINLILQSDEFSIRAIKAFQELRLSARKVEALLEQLVIDQWFIFLNGQYALGMRALMELGEYLSSHYSETIKSCHVCSEMVTTGERCQNKTCEVHFHRHCATSYFRSSGITHCPACKLVWSNVNTFGLMEADEIETDEWTEDDDNANEDDEYME